MLWEPLKLARVTMHLWKERKISGLFLSSSVFRDPDHVTEKQIRVLHILRRIGFTGYIHLRLMPGVSFYFIREALELADRVGVNLEAPNKEVFEELCSDKGGFNESILKRLTWIVDEVKRIRREAHKARCGFARSGVDTQMIVGAVDDNDWQYLQATEWLYKKQGLKRVYYSGFEPVSQTPLEKHAACPPYRENRLYQCSFLIRDYGFRADAFAQVVSDEGFLPNTDPKLAYIKANRDMFPIDLNTATYHEIMRIPRVGPTRARRIMEARNDRKIRYSQDLEGIIGAALTRRISQYVDLKDRRMTDFLKESK